MCTVKLWNGAAFTSLPAANEEACKDGAALMALIRIRADVSHLYQQPFNFFLV